MSDYEGRHQLCECRLCGIKIKAATNRRFCKSCRALEFRRNIKMAEAIKRSRHDGQKTL